jgi:hypothetical protein
LVDLSWGVFFLLVILVCFYELVVYRIASRGAAEPERLMMWESD